MYFTHIVLFATFSIVSTELPIFGNRYNIPSNFQSGNKFPLNGFNDNDWIIRPPTSSAYGPPSPEHNPDFSSYPIQRPHISQDSNGVPAPNQYPHNHGRYSYKPSTYFRVGNIKSDVVDVPRFDKPLFTPTSENDFAATHGQIEKYNKALQEETQLQQLQQVQRQPAQGQEQTAFANGFTGHSSLNNAQPAQSFVSVKFGQNRGQYHYQF